MYKKMFKKLLYLLMITMMLSIIPGCDNSNDGSSSDTQASLTIDNSAVTFDSNSTATITATAKKADGTDDSITAVSSDTLKATVSVSGLVVTITGVKAGSSTVTVTSGSGLTKTCSATLNASWHTFFEDDFNRADSADNDLGAYWTVTGLNFGGTTGAMKIISNEVVTTGDWAYVVYNDTIDTSIAKISVMVTTTTDPEEFQVLFRTNSDPIGTYTATY